ncbi:hypothetical protein [Persephonella sp.]|uniref:hypothetical protein n=1 Tax=Persephonella sp. TaxID=2060922 RepID=UPI002634B68B|nr:hypothetical protein [Persephonella sp.]
MDAIKEQWEELPEWQKILLVGILTVLVLYGIYVLYIEPKQVEEKRLKEEVNNLQIQVDRLKRFARPEIRKKLEDKLAQVKAEIHSLNKQLQEIKSVIPTEEQTQEILRFISDAAMRSDMAMNEFKVSNPEEVYMRYNKSRDRVEIVTDKAKKKDKSFIKINRVKVQLDMNSRNIASLIMFLRRLGQSNRFFSLDNISIEKATGKQFNAYKIKVVVSTYFM